ncbi:reverse transcriptase [Teladorsagia circumcincta]|uniref:Reverse transcriptase n=1 Tax=Teladorsagia circumcincta TaxID=45464 RepID=A0A2G9TSR6_TELCI|nr:reverse transcriptase [Teladorsagia circumcincta]
MSRDGNIPVNEDVEHPADDQHMEERDVHEDVFDAVIRLDPRDLNAIIQAVKADTPSTSKLPSTTCSFKREGFGRQFDFNNDVIQKLTPLQSIEGVTATVSDVIQDLTVRNETLKIADSYPQVFNFLDIKKKSEALKTMDSKLGVTYYPRVTQGNSGTSIKRMRTEGDRLAISAEEKATGPKNAQEINKLLSTGAIREVLCDSQQQLHIHPLSVAKGKKLRLVLDLSHLNQFLHVPKIKLDDMSSILNVLPEKGFMATFDLRSGYHHVRISESHTEYLGFRWGERVFKFLCLPFGLASAPFIFTKLLRSFIKVWRAQGRGLAIYIDDGIIFERSMEACAETVSIVRADLRRAGWFFAEDKCKWSPSQTCKWLGFHIDLSSMIISVSADRLSKAVQRLETLYNLSRPSLYDRLRWAGTTSSLHVVLNNEDKRNTRAVSREIAAAQSQNCDCPKVGTKPVKRWWSCDTG